MAKHKWVKGFPGAVTVCDKDGRIIEMNEAAVEAFAKEGGEKLIGTNVLDCHPEPSRSKLKKMIEEGRTNVYTIQKKGRKNSSTRRRGSRAGVPRASSSYRSRSPGICPTSTAIKRGSGLLSSKKSGRK
jgi:PAS domain S-box-containing protein